MHAGELLKAQAYLALAPHDDKSQHNLSLLRQRLAQRPQPQGPGGVYWQYAGRGVWSEVVVKPQGERWLIDFSGYAMPQMGLYYGPNMGDFSAELPIEHGKAVYHQHESDSAQVCDVTMAFGEQALEMHTRGIAGSATTCGRKGDSCGSNDPPRRSGRGGLRQRGGAQQVFPGFHITQIVAGRQQMQAAITILQRKGREALALHLASSARLSAMCCAVGAPLLKRISAINAAEGNPSSFANASSTGVSAMRRPSL